MSFSSQGLKVISILDYICFRLFPGGAFLFVVGKILVSIDESLRSSQSPWLFAFIIFEIFILASLLVWVLAGDEVYRQRTNRHSEKEKNVVSFAKHLVGFGINFLLIFFFTPQDISLVRSLAFSGTVYTLGSFLLEFVLVLQPLFRLKNKEKKAIRKDLLLGLFGLAGYIIPLLWVSVAISHEFSHPVSLLVNIIFVMVSRL